jgi:hypothetical protein
LTTAEIETWLHRHVPEGWFTGPPAIEADDDEILILGALDAATDGDGDGDPALDGQRLARSQRVQRFRAETREQRMRIAEEAQQLFGRKVAWGVTIGDERTLFTTLSIPVMTRLRLPERQVLDTLVQAGVARSRSEALAWCVRLVGRHEAEWISELRDALVRVNELRRKGPA